MIRIYLLVIAMSMAASGKAQKTLSGLIIDTKGQPVVSASVIVQPCDTTAHDTQITVSDVDGRFSFHAVTVPYRLTIQHMAYLSLTKTDSVSDIRVVLKEKETTLGEVIVKGERPAVTTTQDGGVSFSGEQTRQKRPVETALEMIEELPMIVKNGESLTLMGVTETSILINGKKKMLSDEQLRNYLKAIPASAVKSLDVYYSTPPKFGVRGASVNIVISTPRHQELHVRGEGFASANYNHGTRLDGGANVSLASKRWSLNAGYTDHHLSKCRHQVLEATHQIHDYNHDVLQTTNTKSLSKDKTAILNLSFNPNDIFGLDVDYVYMHKSPKNTIEYNSLIDRDTSAGNTYSQYHSDAHNVRVGLTYKNLEIGGEYEHFQENVAQMITSDQEENMDNHHNQIYNGVNVYLHGESKLFNRHIEYGIDGTLRNTTNYVSENNHSTTILSQRELETTAYIGMKIPLGKNGFINTSLQGEYINSTYNRNRGHKEKLWRDFDIYPTFTLMYKFNPRNILQAGLSSTKYYPSYWANASYSSYIDNYSRIEGNPSLNPSRKYGLNVNYIYKGKYIVGLFGETHKNYFTQLLKLQNDEIAAVYKYFNIRRNQRLGLMGIVPISWTRNLESKFTLMGFYMRQKGTIEEIDLNKSRFSGRISMSNNLNLWSDKLQAEITGWVQFPVIQGIYDVKTMGSVTSKLDWNTPIKGMTVSIKAEDPFNTLRSRVRSNVTRQRYNFRGDGDSRNVSFTIRYTFNGYKAKNRPIATNERLGF